MSFSANDGLGLLQHYLSGVLGSGAFTPPTALHVGLSTTVPTVSGGNVTEPTDGAYARLASGTFWEAVAEVEGAPVIRNTSPLAFVALGTQITALSAVLYDAASGGTFRGSFPLNGGAGYVILANQPFTINARGLVLTLNLNA